MFHLRLAYVFKMRSDYKNIVCPFHGTLGVRRGLLMDMRKSQKVTSSGSIVVLLACILLGIGKVQAQSLTPRVISVGGVFGDPSGITMRIPFGISRAFDIGFGPDYFGSPRLQVDYVWVFHAFKSNVFSEYWGPGLAVAFAKGINSFYTNEPMKEHFAATEDNSFQIGGRAIFGLSITPKAVPFEFFVETGPLLPVSRVFDLDFDGAVGVRYKL